MFLGLVLMSSQLFEMITSFVLIRCLDFLIVRSSWKAVWTMKWLVQYLFYTQQLQIMACPYCKSRG